MIKSRLRAAGPPGGCAPRRSVTCVRGHVISGARPETWPGTRAADLPVRPLPPLPDSGTAAEPAFQLVVGNAVLYGPGLELRPVNRIGQRPRRLLSKFCPPSVTKQVDDMLPAEFLWSHSYRQSLLVLKHSLAVISARLAQPDPRGTDTGTWRSCGSARSCSSRESAAVAVTGQSSPANRSHAACFDTPSALPVRVQLIPRVRKMPTWSCTAASTWATTAWIRARQASSSSSAVRPTRRPWVPGPRR
jgi:hypothetical protein